MSDYRKLKVWEYAHKFTLDIYRTTCEFPEEEKFGLTSQLRRATSSIPTNIAEGCGQLTEENFARFLGIARGSAFEVSYLLYLSKDLGYINKDKYVELIRLNITVMKMLHRLIEKLKKDRDLRKLALKTIN